LSAKEAQKIRVLKAGTKYSTRDGDTIQTVLKCITRFTRCYSLNSCYY